MTRSTVPMAQADTAEGVILDALQNCFAPLISPTGIKRVFRLPPKSAPIAEELPSLMFLLGDERDPYPDDNPGSFLVARTYIARLLISPQTLASQDEGDEGDENYSANIPWIGIIRQWVINHQRLEDVNGLEGLANLANSITVRGSAPKPIPAPGGQRYWGINFELDITIRIPMAFSQH